MQPEHLARLRDTTLDDRDVCARVQTKERLGDTDLRVVTERRARHTEGVGERADQHLFGGRLAVAAGDRDDGTCEQAPRNAGKCLDGRCGICDDDEGIACATDGGEFAAQRDCSAGVERGTDKGVPISLRLQCDEEVAFAHAATGVDDGAFAASVTVSDQFAASPGCNLRRCRGPNHGLELSARSNFRRTKGDERTRSSASSAWPTA